jgi:hypothetical protein
MTDKIFHDRILPLVEVIESTLKSKQEKGTLEVDIALFDRWEVASLDYSDKGFHLAMRGCRISKPFTISSSIKIAEIVKKTLEYQSLIEFAKTNTHITENPVNLVNYFITDVIEKFFEDPAAYESKINGCVDALIADLKNEPNNTRAIIEFYGIILHKDEIKLSSEIILRKPKKEDFNIDLVWTPISSHPDFPEPTAILEIILQAKDREDVINEIKKTIIKLQLFRSIAINWHIYKIYSESYNPIFKRNDPPIDKHLTFENYILKEQELIDLKNFWDEITPIFPQLFNRTDTGNFDYKSIAYHRYNDSLSQIDSLERRITNAMMGLEALFYKPTGEREELQYRLAMRIAKVLGLLYFDPVEVKGAIKDAYNIRSIFSHGGHIGNLSRNEKRKYETNYGKDLRKLVQLVHDYLRVSIIVSMTIQLKKIEFIEDIDNAMIDNSFNQRLISNLEKAKSISDITKNYDITT